MKNGAGSGQTAGPSTAPLAILLREASLRMTLLLSIRCLPEVLPLGERATVIFSMGCQNNEEWCRVRANRRSFDCASRDTTARGFAQDDTSLKYPMPTGGAPI